MGVYATTTAVSLLFPGYFISNTSTSDAEGLLIASKHIDRAEDRVTAALALRYDVPFSPTPPIVRTIVEDIAVYNLMRSGGARQGFLNEYLTESYKDSMDLLKKLASGEMPLTNTDGSYVTPKTTSRYKNTAENFEMIFNVDEPTNWSPTDTEKDDVADTRD